MLQYGLNAYASDFMIDENDIWFVPFGYNYLCCYDLKQNVMKEKIRLPVKNNKFLLYGSIMKSRNEIILIPFKADCSIVYDTGIKQIKKFSSDKLKYEGVYRACFVENHIVWMFPWIKKFPDIQDVYIKKMNLTDGRTEFFEVFSKSTMLRNTGAMRLLNGNCVHIENNIYIGYRNYIIEIDLMNNHSKTYIVGDDKTVYTTMCMVGSEQLCMMDIYGNVIIWNRKNRQLIKIRNENICLNLLSFPNGYREGFGSSIIYKDEYIWFIPSHADRVLELNLKNNILSEAWFSKDICKNVMKEPDCCGQFSRAHISGEYLYIWNLWDVCFFIINIKHHSVERRYIQSEINPDEFCSMFKECMEEKEGICREEIFGVDGLDIFIQSIPVRENDRYILYENAGKKIYRVIASNN